MSRRTIAIAAALSVLVLGSLLITPNTKPLANEYYNKGIGRFEEEDYHGAIANYTKALEAIHKMPMLTIIVVSPKGI